MRLITAIVATLLLCSSASGRTVGPTYRVVRVVTNGKCQTIIVVQERKRPEKIIYPDLLAERWRTWP